MSEWSTERSPEHDGGAAQKVDAPVKDDPQQREAQQDYIRQLSKDGGETAEAPKDQGLANYEASLGKFLGKPLYKAVSKQVTPDKVYKHAERALEKSIKYLTDQLDAFDTADQIPPGIFEQLGSVLQAEVQPEVEAFLKEGYGREMVESLAGWVDAHPRTIALVAILAAAGAILANADIPKLSTRFKINDRIKAKFSAKLGQFQNIQLEEIRAELEANGTIAGATYQAKLFGEYGAETGEKVGGQIRLEDQQKLWWLQAGAQHDQTGQSAELSGGAQSADGRWYGEGNARYHTEEGTSWGGKVGYRPNDRYSTEVRAYQDQARGTGAEMVGSYRGGKKDSRWSAEVGAGWSEKMGNTIRAGIKWTF